MKPNCGAVISVAVQVCHHSRCNHGGRSRSDILIIFCKCSMYSWTPHIAPPGQLHNHLFPDVEPTTFEKYFRNYFTMFEVCEYRCSSSLIELVLSCWTFIHKYRRLPSVDSEPCHGLEILLRLKWTNLTGICL